MGLGHMDWTIQLALCNILLYTQYNLQKWAIQVSSCQLIGLSSLALTKLSNFHPAAPYLLQCQNPQTINYHTCIHCNEIGLAFLWPLK